MSEEKDVSMWVVMPIGWNYDDSTYNRQGYDTPRNCFTIREMAMEFAKESSIKQFKDIATENYFGGFIDTWWLGDDVKDRLVSWGIDIDSMRVPSEVLVNLSEDNILEIMEHLELKFYDVAELKIVC